MKRLLPIGIRIISYNGWLNFQTTAFADQFKTLSFDDVQRLVPGDTVYTESTEYPHGKVYGRTKVAIVKIERLSMEVVRVNYKGGPQSGCCICKKDDGCLPFEIAIDENRLASLVDLMPDSTIWGLH